MLKKLAPIIILLSICVENIAGFRCPTKCTCDPKKRSVKCVNLNLNQIPSDLPAETEILDLSKNHIQEVADNAFQNIPQVQSIDLSNNEISKLNGRSFAGLNNLRLLNLKTNKLSDNVDLTSLSDLDELKNLFLSFNRLTKIPSIESKSLQKLILDGNRIETAKFPDSFKVCDNLQSVVLSNNKIKFISSGDLTNIGGSNVKSLLLKSNSISDIDPGAFVPVNSNLETLNLGRNKLDENGLTKALSGFAKCGNPALLTLSVNHNKLSKIDSNLFKPFQNGVLRNLQLNGNPISTIETAAFYPFIKSLSILSMVHCNLQDVPLDFSEFTSLTQLALDKNHLKSLPNYLPTNLKQLSASNNDIVSWEGTTFDNLHNLVKLDLSANSLKNVDDDSSGTGLGNILKTVKTINLNGNPFDCTCKLNKFIVWAKSNTKKVLDWNKYRCSTPTKSRGTLLSNVDMSACGKSEL